MGYRDWREMQAEKIGGPADAPRVDAIKKVRSNTMPVTNLVHGIDELLDAIRTHDTPEEYTTHHARSEQYKHGYRDGMMQVVERIDNLLYDLKLKKARR